MYSTLGLDDVILYPKAFLRSLRRLTTVLRLINGLWHRQKEVHLHFFIEASTKRI